MLVLALDLGSVCTGWAESRDGETTSGSWPLEKLGKSPGQRLSGFHIELLAFLTESEPHKVVCFEMPFVTPKTHQNTALALMGLAAITHMVAEETSTVVDHVGSSTWRKHYLGVGKLTGIGSKEKQRKRFKEMAITRGIQLGFDPKTEDEAEALGILDWKLAQMKVESLTGAGPLFDKGRAA